MWLGQADSKVTREPESALTSQLIQDFEEGVQSEVQTHNASLYGYKATTLNTDLKNHKLRRRRMTQSIEMRQILGRINLHCLYVTQLIHVTLCIVYGYHGTHHCRLQEVQDDVEVSLTCNTEKDRHVRLNEHTAVLLTTLCTRISTLLWYIALCACVLCLVSMLSM